MIRSILGRIFGARSDDRVTIVLPVETEEIAAMRKEQREIQIKLGFPEDDAGGWLRLHQILLDHETRLAALESQRNGD